MYRLIPVAASFVLAIALALSCATSSFAQDPRGSAAQHEAREWLALTDRDDASASWKRSGPVFQQQMPETKWRVSLDAARKPLGAVKSRTVERTEFSRNPANTPPGDYAHLLFRTEFDKKPDARESVTLRMEADGTWHVVGYFIR